VICLLHGLGDHSQRFGTHFARFFTDAGYAILTLDLRGHGKSGGARGHINTIDDYMEDIDVLLGHAASLFPGLPVFLYGHSLGAILALHYGLQRRPSLNGVIATDPALKSALEEQKGKIALVKVLGSIIPTLTLPSGLIVKDLSRDPQVVSDYQKDPLVHGVATLGFGKCSLAAIRWIFDRAAEFPIPLLLMHGSGDRIAYLKGSQELAHLAGSCCTLKVWDGYYHEIHNDIGKEQVLSYTVTWLNEHL
jgi:alpha-beta hydrolase superfamily lysophospholipase